MLKKLLPTAFAVTALAASVSAQTTKSISGSVDFRVTLPEVLVLYHWDDAHLNLTDVATTANDSDVREISDTAAHELPDTLNKDAYTIKGDVVTTDNTKFESGKVAVTLKNAWGVRALSNGDVKLRVAEQVNTLKNITVDTSTITISDTKIKSEQAKGTKEVAANTDLVLPSGWELSKGDITFNMDLTNAKHVGEYNTRGKAGAADTVDEKTDTFLLTLTGN